MQGTRLTFSRAFQGPWQWLLILQGYSGKQSTYLPGFSAVASSDAFWFFMSSRFSVAKGKNSVRPVTTLSIPSCQDDGSTLPSLRAQKNSKGALFCFTTQMTFFRIFHVS